MIICLVTDRRRLSAALGAAISESAACLLDQIEAAAHAGVDLVQIREPDLDGGRMVELVRAATARRGRSKTRILVNDRLDVALAAGADGVHLKETSLSPSHARQIAPPGFIVSCAVHSALTATARRSADFIVAGTVLPTVSKSRADYLGWKGLGEVVAAAKGTPVLAIGGIDERAVAPLVERGAAGLAAVGAFIPPLGTTGVAEFVKKRVIDMRFAFDSAQRDP